MENDFMFTHFADVGVSVAEFARGISRGLAINFQSPRLKIDDPIFGNRRRRIQSRLAPVQTKAGITNLHRNNADTG